MKNFTIAKNGFAITISLILTGCAYVWAPYDAPSDKEALGAIKEAIRTDWIERSPELRPMTREGIDGELPSGYFRQWANTAKNIKDLNTQTFAQNEIDGLKNINMGSCNWGSIWMSQVEEASLPRVKDTAHAYFCEYVKFASDPRGEIAWSLAEGYFWREGEKYQMTQTKAQRWIPLRHQQPPSLEPSVNKLS